MRIAKELGALQVKRLNKPGLHAVGGVPGLLLRVPEGDAPRYWILRVMVGAARREMGLGSYSELPLAVARERAREARELIRKGLDPILERKKARSALVAEQQRAKTFDQAVTAFMDAKGDEWRNAKHRQQWQNTLAQYASPIMGKVLVSSVTQAHIESVLRPIWREKTETATRVRQRIEKVLDFARVSGWRDGENPARWRGHLAELFPKPSKIKVVQHQAALDPRSMHPFVKNLRAAKGTAARALEFLILTAARSGEVRGARWSEVDMHAGTWTVPAARMKANKEHRVPLSREALALLKSLPRLEDNDLIFPAPRGGVMSDMTMTAVLRRLKVEATVHGMRSSFRVWTQDHTSYPREIAEVALSHSVGNAVEQAYARGDLLERRRKMMQDWSEYLSRPASSGTSSVTKLRAA